jgi:hypothetical protein
MMGVLGGASQVEEFEDTKSESESEYQRTDNTMVKKLTIE